MYNKMLKSQYNILDSDQDKQLPPVRCCSDRSSRATLGLVDALIQWPNQQVNRFSPHNNVPNLLCSSGCSFKLSASQDTDELLVDGARKVQSRADIRAFPDEKIAVILRLYGWMFF